MIITIKSSLASARIDSMGAQLISLKDVNSTEYIWQRNPKIWANCSPLLFPIVGNCRNNMTVIEGSTCEIPKHGFCKTTEFQLISQTENSVTFGFDYLSVPIGSYPYRFAFHATYTLTGQTLDLNMKVINQDNREIAYCIGTHPGFICPLFEGERFEDYQLVFDRQEAHGYRRYDTADLQFDMSREYPFPGDSSIIPLSRSLFTSDAIWFDQPASRKASLVNPKTGRGVRLSFESFTSIAFWTQTSDEASFLCLEPWNGSAVCSDEDDDFLHKNHLQKLSPGDSGTYSLFIDIL